MVRGVTTFAPHCTSITLSLFLKFQIFYFVTRIPLTVSVGFYSDFGLSQLTSCFANEWFDCKSVHLTHWKYSLNDALRRALLKLWKCASGCVIRRNIVTSKAGRRNIHFSRGEGIRASGGGGVLSSAASASRWPLGALERRDTHTQEMRLRAILPRGQVHRKLFK